jgi:hypothetical protein
LLDGGVTRPENRGEASAGVPQNEQREVTA